MKVYCENCVYLVTVFKGAVLPSDQIYKCHYPKNYTMSHVDKWLHPPVQLLYCKKPCEINRFNDCKWYKESAKIAREEEVRHEGSR